MPDLATTYAEARASTIALARTLLPEQLRTTVPACPDWTVLELLAHVSSVAAGMVESKVPPGLNLSAFGDDEMAKVRDAYVDELLAERRDWPLERVIEEWERTSVRLEAMMRGEQPWPDESPPFSDWITLTDLAVHHHDMRGALRIPGDRDSRATRLSLRSYVAAMGFRVERESLPTLRLRAGDLELLAGADTPAATVAASAFELARAASGRRSWTQVRAYDWEGDPEPFRALFFPYGERADALVEDDDPTVE